MAKRRRKTTKAAAPKALSQTQKKRFLEHLTAAEDGLKTLAASVKSLRRAAAEATFVGAYPAAAKRRRRKRG